MRLAEASLQLPHRLFLDGVQYAPEALGRLVSRGSQAIVYRGQWRTSGLCNYMKVAVKNFHQYDPQSLRQPFMIEAHYMQVSLRVIIRRLPRYPLCIMCQAIMKEIILLSFFRHSNICHLLGAVRVVGGSSVALVLPWMQHSNVTEYLSTSGEQRIASIMCVVHDDLACNYETLMFFAVDGGISSGVRILLSPRRKYRPL